MLWFWLINHLFKIIEWFKRANITKPQLLGLRLAKLQKTIGQPHLLDKLLCRIKIVRMSNITVSLVRSTWQNSNKYLHEKRFCFLMHSHNLIWILRHYCCIAQGSAKRLGWEMCASMRTLPSITSLNLSLYGCSSLMCILSTTRLMKFDGSLRRMASTPRRRHTQCNF